MNCHILTLLLNITFCYSTNSVAPDLFKNVAAQHLLIFFHDPLLALTKVEYTYNFKQIKIFSHFNFYSIIFAFAILFKTTGKY